MEEAKNQCAATLFSRRRYYLATFHPLPWPSFCRPLPCLCAPPVRPFLASWLVPCPCCSLAPAPWRTHAKAGPLAEQRTAPGWPAVARRAWAAACTGHWRLLPASLSHLLAAAHPLLTPLHSHPPSWQGVTSALVFANLGASYGTAKSSVGIVSMGIMHPTEVGGCAAQRGAPPHCARPSLTPPRAHCALPTPLALPR